MRRLLPDFSVAWERRARSKKWAVVRAVLGLAQMTGAWTCFTLLIQGGGAVSRELYLALGATTSLVVTSLLLFGRRGGPRSGRK
jgi:hypothetical protein